MPHWQVSNREIVDDILVAANKGDLEQARRAISNDPSCVNKQDRDGMTALHIAIFRWCTPMVVFLANQPNIDFGIKDRWGRSFCDASREAGNEDRMIPIILPLSFAQLGMTGHSGPAEIIPFPRKNRIPDPAP